MHIDDESPARAGFAAGAATYRDAIAVGHRGRRFAAISFGTAIEQVLGTLPNGAALVLPEPDRAPGEPADRGRPAGEVHRLADPGKANASALAERPRAHGDPVRAVPWPGCLTSIGFR